MKMTRAWAAIVVVLGMGPLLAGCVAEAPVIKATNPSDIAAQLVSSLNKRDGIVAAYAENEPLAIRGGEIYPYAFTIDGGTASDADIVEAITATWHELLGTPFAHDKLYVRVDLGNEATVELDKRFEDWDVIGERQLAEELEYWLAVRHVVEAPTSLTISSYPDRDGYVRGLAVQAEVETIDMDSLRAVPEVEHGAIDQRWYFRQFASVGALPSSETLELVARLHASASDSGGLNVSIDTQGSPQPRVYVSVDLNGADVNALPTYYDWDGVLAVLNILVTSTDPDLARTFSIQPDRSSSDGLSSVTLGRCPHKPFAGEYDIALFDLLSGEGLLPEGSAPGQCPTN